MITNKKSILRLSKYKKALTRLHSMGFKKVFSDNLADAIGVTPSQVRKDFSIFDLSGHKKGGYLIDDLIHKINKILGKEEVEKVISLAKKYNVFVIIDEIHSDLIVGDRKFVSGADFINEYKNIAICNAPSKTFNLAGLCTAYTIIPDEELRELEGDDK